MLLHLRQNVQAHGPLFGRYRDGQGAGFRLGAFHDQLISYGTLPLSVIEWLMFDDESSLRETLK